MEENEEEEQENVVFTGFIRNTTMLKISLPQPLNVLVLDRKGLKWQNNHSLRDDH